MFGKGAGVTLHQFAHFSYRWTILNRASMKGRKPKSESRASEIRASPIAWKQMPEFMRLSLRALARQVGISHQLLGHYLSRLDEWQSKEYFRQARESHASAAAENRPLTTSEEQQANACDRAGRDNSASATRGFKATAPFPN
jgi:hypothetical protein